MLLNRCRNKSRQPETSKAIILKKEERSVQEYKKNKNYIRASAKVLKSNNFKHLEAIKTSEKEGDEEMTLKQLVRLIKALKEKSHTLDEIIEILEHMANDTN